MTYAYDSMNRLVTVTDPYNIVVTTNSYDENGNLVEVKDAKGYATRYTYDLAGRIIKVTDPEAALQNGFTESYEYNQYGERIKQTDGLGNTITYSYDKAGRLIKVTDSLGVTTQYTYDRAGRVIKVEAPGKTTVYAYDNAGNRQSHIETYTSNQSSGFIDGDSGEEIEYIVKTSRYFYSNTNRLIKLVEEMSDGSGRVFLEKTIDYLYDGNGNEVASNSSYLRPTGGTLKKSLRGSVHGENQPTAPDTLIDRTNNTYDSFNRLKAVEKIENGIRTSVEYTYNGDDLRTQKVVKSSDDSYTPRTTSFLYDRQHVILETDSTGEVKTRYVRGINYIAQYSSVGNSSEGGTGDGSDEPELLYFLFNGHGDTVQTVTGTGEVKNRYDYDIFGSPTLTIEVTACSIRYAGEYLDNETGLYYLRARYYNPYTGRFISEDSYWGEDDNPLSLNLYTYAYNNPVRFADPSGHNSKRIEVIIKLIDTNKEIWWAAQNNTNITAAQRKEIQDSAHARAEELRAELAELEKGNEAVENLVKQSGDDAGTWEKYKASKIEEKIQSKSDAIYEEQRNEARKLEERNWFQKMFGISNYESRYDELDKVTMEELNKLYKLKAASAMAVELGRNIFDDEIELNEEVFKIKPKEGQIYKVEHDSRELQLKVLNGIYFEQYKKGIDRHLQQEYPVFDYYNYKHYKKNRYEIFRNVDDGTWADYLNMYGPTVDLSFGSTTWEELGQGVVKTIEICAAIYMLGSVGTEIANQAIHSYNYYSALFNFQQYFVKIPSFNFSISASGQAALAGTRTINIRLPYVGTLETGAALDSTISFATFYDKYPALFADGFGSGVSGGLDPFDKGTPKTVDDILESATPGRVTKGKTTLHEKPGDFSQASKEFDSLNPSNVKDINTSYGQGKTGTLPDGRTITVRPGSTDSRPTLEIRNPNGRGIEIRYGK